MSDQQHDIAFRKEGADIRARGRQIMYGMRLENILDKLTEVTLSNDLYNDIGSYNKYRQGVRRIENLLHPYIDQQYIDSIVYLQELPRRTAEDMVHILDNKLDILVDLMKRKGFAPLDDVRHNIWWIIRDIENKIGDEDDVQIIITGRRGTGKSTTGIEIARQWAEHAQLEFDVTKQVFKDPIAIRKFIYENKPPIGTPIIWDEAGASKGMGRRRAMTRESIEFNEIIQTIRELQLVMIYTAPKEKQFDSDTIGMFSAWLETVRLVKEDKLCYCKYKVKQGDYWVYLQDTNKNRITEISIPKAPQVIVSHYKRWKKKMMYDKVKVDEDEKPKKYKISLSLVKEAVRKKTEKYKSPNRKDKLNWMKIYQDFKGKGLTQVEAKEVQKDMEAELYG